MRGFGISLLTLLVLDGLWLGVFMSDFYRQQLGPLARTVDGRLDPLWPVAALVYPVLAAGLTVFVLSRGGRPLDAALYGAIYGMITFAVYDLTNQATLRDWSATMTLVDIAWGGISCGLTAWVASSLARP